MSFLTNKNGPPQVTNTTSENLPPQYVQNAQQNLIGLGNNLTNPFTEFAPQYGTAGFNPDQTMGFDLARQSAQDAFFSPVSPFTPQSSIAQFMSPSSAQATPMLSGPAAEMTAAQAGSPYQSSIAQTGPAAQSAIAQMGPAAQSAIAQMGPAAQAAFRPGTAEQLRPGEILPFMNPYLQGVLDPTLANMRRQNDETQTGIRAKTAAAGAFGGSRGALMEAQQSRAFGEQVATTAAQLMAQGYDKATALAEANAQMRQQTGLQNTQIENNVGMFNTGQTNQGRMFDVGQANQVGMHNTDATNQGRMFDASQANNVGMYNAGQTNQLGMFDTGQGNQVSMFNAGQGNARDQYNAGLLQQGNQTNAGAANDMAKFVASQGNQMGLSNAQMANALAQAFGLQRNTLLDNDANRGMTAASLNNTLQNDTQSRQLRALQQLLGIGDYQRTAEQSAIDLPFTNLQRLIASTPGMNNVGGTTQGSTAAPTTSNPLAAALGVSLLGKSLLGSGGLLAGLSDENEKTNKQKLGVDPKTGLDIYAFDYKSDVEKAKRDGSPMPPKRVGPMAQDIERLIPGSTTEIGGKKIIPGATRTLLGV